METPEIPHDVMLAIVELVRSYREFGIPVIAVSEEGPKLVERFRDRGLDLRTLISAIADECMRQTGVGVRFG